MPRKRNQTLKLRGDVLQDTRLLESRKAGPLDGQRVLPRAGALRAMRVLPATGTPRAATGTPHVTLTRLRKTIAQVSFDLHCRKCRDLTFINREQNNQRMYVEIRNGHGCTFRNLAGNTCKSMVVGAFVLRHRHGRLDR